jgi:outer membrane protein assembly factor BamA
MRAQHRRGLFLTGVMLPLLWLTPAQALISLGKNATLVPLPEIITDPNEGQTLGVLATILLTNDREEIRRIIAPDVRYNTNTGMYPMFRLFDYPTSKEKILLQAGKATKTGEYFEASYEGQDLFDGLLDLRARAFHENDPFERFFGFGNDTPGSNETNYTSDTGILLAWIAFNLPYSFQLTTQSRLRVARIRSGGVDSVDQLVRVPRFAGTPGLDGATIVGQRFGFRWDTRDASDITTQGYLVDAGAEVVDRALGSSSSFIKYGLEGRSFFSLRRDKRLILASQAVVDYIEGADRAPFFERNSLGGVRSLRGFGSNRFIDNHRCFIRTELRSNVWEPAWLTEQFKVRGHLEAAPFFEIGQVFSSSRTFPLGDPHTVGGVAFRAVVPPQLIAYVDVGTDGGSPSVFTGIDYPF